MVQGWKKKCTVTWCAIEGSSGEAETTAWEARLEMEKYSCRVEEMDKKAVTLVVDLANAFEKVPIKVVWQWATHFGSDKEFCFKPQLEA